MNSGIAISVVESVPAAVSMTSTSGGRPRYKSVASAAAHSETATDTPSASSTANTPNRIASAISAASLRAARTRARARTARTARRRRRTADSSSPVGNGAPGVLTAHVASIERRAPAREHDADRGRREQRERVRSTARQTLPRRRASNAKRKCVSWRTPTAAANISAVFKQQQRDGLGPARGRVEHVARKHLPRPRRAVEQHERAGGDRERRCGERAQRPRGDGDTVAGSSSVMPHRPLRGRETAQLVVEPASLGVAQMAIQHRLHGPAKRVRVDGVRARCRRRAPRAATRARSRPSARA